MSVIMLCHGFANGRPCPYEGQYLMSFTPHAPIKGTFTDDPKKAKRYQTVHDLFAEWKYSIGTRPDGMPDRPLTAFTIEAVRLGEDE